MSFWFIALLLLAATVGALLWPLISQSDANKRRHLIAICVIIVLVPAGTMLIYYHLGSPM